MERVHHALLVSVVGSFHAKVLAARLRDEGMDPELRGPVDSPYPVTMGDLARIDLYVPEDQLEDARLVLLAIEVDDATDLRSRRSVRPAAVLPVLVALALLAVAVLAPLARLLGT